MTRKDNWRAPGRPLVFPDATSALAHLDLSKRSETDARLRLVGIEFEFSGDDLLLKERSSINALALNYTSFEQYCGVLGLSKQVPFLRTLGTSIVADILHQYTADLPATEVKLVIRQEKREPEQGVKPLYVIRHLATRVTSTTNPTERWLYWLEQFEAYGWLQVRPMLLQGDYLLAAMYDPRLTVDAKTGSGDGYLGFVIGNSEAGLVKPVASAIVYWPVTGQWLPVNEPTLGGLLTQGLAEALTGNIGMFGLLSAFREASRFPLQHALSAHASVTVETLDAHSLLKAAGLTTNAIVATIGQEVLHCGRLTNLGLVLRAAKPLNDLLATHPRDALPDLIQLGWALWK